jgi:hypothetical protein
MRVGMLALACSLALSTPVLGATAEELIEPLQRQIDALQKQLDELKRAHAEAAAHVANAPAVSSAATGATQPGLPHAVALGGQYRINAYSADNDLTDDKQTAARLRLRQNVDITFNEQFRTHLQFELGHTTDNVGTTGGRRGGKSTTMSVRHAVLDYSFRSGNLFDGANLQAGLLPLQDDFRQTQFSADWNYNPLAAALLLPVGNHQLRLFAANLDEGLSETGGVGEFLHYQADYRLNFDDAGTLTFSGTLLDAPDAIGSGSSRHYNYGIGGSTRIGRFTLGGFVLGSHTDAALLDAGRRARGTAGLLELGTAAGSGEFGLLLSHASGRADGTGYLMPMAFAGTFGYWGYTGILTVQGPTDTGFDFDGINLSNNGHGLSSVQAKYAFPIAPALDGYLAAGWFGNTRAAGRSEQVGIDLLAMGTYRFNPVLALDFGASYAELEDSVSGYFRGVQTAGGAGFNQAVGQERTKWALFARLQAEF